MDAEEKKEAGGEYPILRIKKGVDVRDEPDAQFDTRPGPLIPEKVSPYPKPVSRQRPRRRMMSGLLPLVIVAIAAVVAYQVLTRQSNEGTVAGYRALLRAGPVGQSLVVSVALGKTDSAPAAAEPVTVKFTIPDTGDELTVSQTLTDRISIVRGTMPYRGGEKSVQAEVLLRGDTLKLTARIGQP